MTDDSTHTHDGASPAASSHADAAAGVAEANRPRRLPRRRTGSLCATRSVAFLALCVALLALPLAPVVGADDPGPDDGAVVQNRTAPGGDLAATLTSHEVRLGASFEAAVLESELDAAGSERARARLLAEFETGLASLLLDLRSRERDLHARLATGEDAASAAHAESARTFEHARGAAWLADRARNRTATLPENSTREAAVEPEAFDRHAAAGRELAGNWSHSHDGSWNETHAPSRGLYGESPPGSYPDDSDWSDADPPASHPGADSDRCSDADESSSDAPGTGVDAAEDCSPADHDDSDGWPFGFWHGAQTAAWHGPHEPLPRSGGHGHWDGANAAWSDRPDDDGGRGGFDDASRSQNADDETTPDHDGDATWHAAESDASDRHDDQTWSGDHDDHDWSAGHDGDGWSAWSDGDHRWSDEDTGDDRSGDGWDGDRSGDGWDGDRSADDVDHEWSGGEVDDPRSSDEGSRGGDEWNDDGRDDEHEGSGVHDGDAFGWTVDAEDSWVHDDDRDAWNHEDGWNHEDAGDDQSGDDDQQWRDEHDSDDRDGSNHGHVAADEEDARDEERDADDEQPLYGHASTEGTTDEHASTESATDEHAWDDGHHSEEDGDAWGGDDGQAG